MTRGFSPLSSVSVIERTISGGRQSEVFTIRFSFLFLTVRIPFCITVNAPISSSTELAVKIKVNVGDGEPIESALRRFKREVNKSGHLMELRHRKHFENSQDRKKRKIKEARMRKKFERIQRRRMAQQNS